MNDIKRYSLLLLDQLEEKEFSLLSWGFVDGHFSRDELEQQANELLSTLDTSVDANELIDSLNNHCLLFSFNTGGGICYRTRFAEAVRLFSQLRQIFKISEWSTAPKLVSGFRLCLRSRTYPKRTITMDKLIQIIQEQSKLNQGDLNALKGLLSKSGSAELKLASFQARSTSHLINKLASNNQGGTIITAGTGTGKTLAFYIPALIKILQKMKKNENWVQIIAIYPRNELLKDQFTQLFKLCRSLDTVASENVGRKISIGAYYGDSPTNANSAGFHDHKWRLSGSGYICPFLRCPSCDKDIVFGEINGKSSVKCSDSQCGVTISSDEIVVSRAQMKQRVPDILFTTTEMLNRLLSSSSDAKVFGVGQTTERSPYALLLDEAHTYDGSHGAHVAHLIRRWKLLVNRPIHFVGLSATLNNPKDFFSQLTSLPVGTVYDINANNDDLEIDGKEYQLALRGDPISGTSLLSTTIQASMLMSRILDQLDCAVSEDIIGRKLFAFTDDLDVTNRLFHNLLNAEGRDGNGNIDNRQKPLAIYRSSIYDDSKIERFLHGQYWNICEQIGHSPDGCIRVGRTSSQDTGVDTTCEAIVATSSLELGFDDPFVGAVIQHKAPRSASSFVQRKGRAGRKRGSRPWTLAVLSDYGRDRVAFQGYEHLFSPLIEKSSLPIANRYILRIQAVYAFIEWISRRFDARFAKGSVWWDFTKPSDNDSSKARQSFEKREVDRLLVNETERNELVQYLKTSLLLSTDEVHALLYEPPRALMTTVLPTLHRLLVSNWTNISGQVDTKYENKTYPLPDFLPANLFSDLNVPEVNIQAPTGKGKEQYSDNLPINLSMRITAPGRVTRRFGYKHKFDTHWIKPQYLENEANQDLPIQDWVKAYEHIGTFQHIDLDKEKQKRISEIKCLRPQEIHMVQKDKDVIDTSNAFLVWCSQLLATSNGERREIPKNTLLSGMLSNVYFFTHNLQCPLKVRRFALGSRATIRREAKQPYQTYIRFTDCNTKEQVSLGFEQFVDAAIFSCNIPDDLINSILSSSNMLTCRTAYFRDQVIQDDVLCSHSDRFTLEWISHIFLAYILKKSFLEAIKISEASASFSNIDIRELENLLKSVFRIVETEQSEKSYASTREKSAQNIHQNILSLLEEPGSIIRTRISDIARCLWENPNSAFINWLRLRIKSTLGGAILNACHLVAPDYQTSDLYVDLDIGPSSAQSTVELQGQDLICISENSGGGNGIIEEITTRYCTDPVRFMSLIEISLAMSGLERVDHDLRRILDIINDTDMPNAANLKDCLYRVRANVDHMSLSAASSSLIDALKASNIVVSHEVMTSLNARILRVGTSEETDRLLYDLMSEWDQMELALGIEVDVRIFAFLASENPTYRQRIETIFSNQAQCADQSILYNIIYSLLWPRGSTVREHILESFNPFCSLPSSDPKLIRDELVSHMNLIRIGSDDFDIAVNSALTDTGCAYIFADKAQYVKLKTILLSLLVCPVEADCLYLYPYISRVQLHNDGLIVNLRIGEIIR